LNQNKLVSKGVDINYCEDSTLIWQRECGSTWHSIDGFYLQSYNT